MRILGVKFLNLNSLRGEHEIRFDQPPFTESGLFAITGPTGAGKTTILDAITVALYARVHRHDKNVEEMMSRHTAECYSEVDFEVKEVVYRAKWSMYRSRKKSDGVIQPEKMELSEVATGKFIGGHTTTLVKEAIKALCGLDYSQFLRSVILSQGDFTRFLKANENERSELLEKITDTGVYSEISRYVFSRQRAEKDKVDALKLRLQHAVILSDEERTAHAWQLQEHDGTREALQQEQAVAVTKMNWLAGIEKLGQKQAQTEASLAAQQETLQLNQDNFTRLNGHRKATTFMPALAEINALRDRAGLIEAELDIAEPLLPQLIAEAEIAEQRLETLDRDILQTQTRLTEVEPLMEKVTRLDGEIGHLDQSAGNYKARTVQAERNVNALIAENDSKKAILLEQEAQLEKRSAWLKLKSQDKDLEKYLIAFKRSRKDLSDLQQTIEAALQELDGYKKREAGDKAQLQQLSEQAAQRKIALQTEQTLAAELGAALETALRGETLAMLEENANRLPLQVNTSEQLLKLSGAYLKNGGEQEIVRTDTRHMQETLVQRNETLERTAKLLDEAEAHLATLRQLVEARQRIQNYEDARLKLSDQEPCPLCGSVHHPYLQGHYVNDLTEAERNRNQQQTVVAALQQSAHELHLEVNTLRVSLSGKESELAALISQKEALHRDFHEINTLLPLSFDIGKPELIGAAIAKTKDAFRQISQRIQALKEQEKEIHVVEDRITALKEVLLTEEGKLPAISERIHSTSAHVERLTAVLAGQQQQREKIIAEASALLSPYDLVFDEATMDQAELLLEKRFNQYGQVMTQAQDLTVSTTALRAELHQISGSLAERTDEQAKLEKEFRHETDKLEALRTDRHTLFGDKDPTQEREIYNRTLKEARNRKDSVQAALQDKQQLVAVTRSKVEQLGKDLQQLTIKVVSLNQELTATLQQNDIISVEALNLMFLPAAEALHLEKTERELDTSITVLKQVLADILAEIQLETGKGMTQETAEALEIQVAEIHEKLTAVNQEIGKLRQVLEEDDRVKRKYADLTREISVQQSEWERWNKLTTLIGSADGKKFSRFAQGLTLSRLTDLANRHLSKLSDRYRILKSKVSDLELLIVDGYQADVVRPMNSLSGGESFLVSLALALGLSDLASRKVQINSLFIDEGFGTLDADTLDTAISALENLQAKGKTIGIISHVEALKERIGTQIQVTKQPGGASRIKVHSYADHLPGN